MKNLNNFIAKTSSEKQPIKKKKKAKDVIPHDDLDENGQRMYNLPRQMPKQAKGKKKKKSPKRSSAKSNRDKSPNKDSSLKEEDLKDYLKALNNLNRQPLNIRTSDPKPVTPVKEHSIEEEESVQ